MKLAHKSCLLALGIFLPALAESRTGNQLFADCTASQSQANYAYADASCIAYIQGFIEGATSFQEMWTTEKKAICIPTGVTAGQMRDVVVRYLGKHPEIRHKSSMQLITTAAIEAFPC